MVSNLDCQENRITYIDLAKGITIILVIIGHSLYGLPRAIIFSFHMPLFFILSGATFRFSNSWNTLNRKVKKSFSHLILPVIYVYVFVTIYKFIVGFNGELSVSTFLYNRLLTLVFASGTSVELGALEIEALGLTWFLVVLFFSRSIFDFINLIFKGKGLIVSILFSILGVVISKVNALPLSFDIALAVLPLFYVGKVIIRINFSENVLIKLIGSLFVWLFMFWISLYFGGTYLELAHRNYPLFPFCFIGAVFGTVTICLLSSIGCGYTLSKPLIHIGKNSFVLMIIHALESQLIFGWWKITTSSYINALFRIIADVILFYIVTLFIDLQRYKPIIHFKKK